MQTHFDLNALARPEISTADEILRKCVHCGFCTATCPTYVLTGDERDSPRGRIWMMRDLLGGGDKQTELKPADVSYHLDRCLTCLSCMTTCPSGVDYMHLVDIGRAEINKKIRRRFADHVIRTLLSITVPFARRFHLALRFARLAKPFSGLLTGRLKAMVNLLPTRLQALDEVGSKDQLYPAETSVGARVMLLSGCAQRALDPEINASTIRLLNRQGVDVVVRSQASCCGALAHHINAEDAAHKQMEAVCSAWANDIASGQLDAIIVNTSGCGTTLKDYGNLMSGNSRHSETARKISDLTMDISEYLNSKMALPTLAKQNMTIAYHAACSLQHGQKVLQAPRALLAQAGFEVKTPAESHLCCGSAGVYNVLQPELSQQLKERKIRNLNRVGADIICAGNLGCIHQLTDASSPICHTIQILDWAYGGPKPDGLLERSG